MIYNWLRNFQDSFRIGVFFLGIEDIKSLNLFVFELVNKFQGFSGFQGLEGFLFQGQYLDYVFVLNSVFVVYFFVVVVIRLFQYGNSQVFN